MVITPRESCIYRKPNRLYLVLRGDNPEEVGYSQKPNRLYLVVRELTLSSEKILSECSIIL